MTPLQEFGKYAASATYKLQLMAEYEREHEGAIFYAMKVYHAHPDLREEMDAIGRDQLWGREFVRLSDKIKAEEAV